MYKKSLILAIALVIFVFIAVTFTLEQHLLDFALKKEANTTKAQLLRVFPDRRFTEGEDKWYQFITTRVLKHPLTFNQKLAISKYAIRILLSLDPDEYATNSLDSVGNYSPFLNILHPHEAQALDASREYILKTNNSLYEINYPQQKDIELILESAILKEVYKTQIPPKTKQSAIKLLQAFTPTYSYQEDRLDNPLNDIVAVKMGPELFARGLGGGTINIEDLSRTDEELGLIILHEKLHGHMTSELYQKYPSLTPDQIKSMGDQGLQEISVTALQYLLAKEVGLPTATVERLDYWDGARDLLVVLAELKQKNLFDLERQKKEFLLMAAEGDFKPIFKQYSQITGIPTSLLDSHFGMLKDEFFYESMQEEYSQTIDSFNKESEKLGIIQKFPILY